jgi:hypothetical protein
VVKADSEVPGVKRKTELSIARASPKTISARHNKNSASAPCSKKQRKANAVRRKNAMQTQFVRSTNPSYALANKKTSVCPHSRKK